MAMKINPPAFDKKTYERYKQELQAWRHVTDVVAKKQGIAVALSLPDDHETKIREKVFDEMKLDDLQKDDGLDRLVTFLDSKLKKDDMTDSLEKYEAFENLKREQGQTITDYIAAFDQKYNKMAKLGMTLPPAILGFKLLDKAGITKNERMLVLTGMDYTEKDQLYEQAKKSLKKFKGEQASSAAASGSITSPAIKLEPAFLAENEEALWAAGYGKIGRSQNQTGYYARGRYPKRGSSRGNYGSGFHNQKVDNEPPNSMNSKRSMNPQGSDGRPILCRSCGSYRHLVKDCPDSWENIAKVNIVDNSEKDSKVEVTLLTGYPKDSLSHLMSDAFNCAVLDSACTSTVCGTEWLNTYLDSLSENFKQKVARKPGTRVFKFGGGEQRKSCGLYSLPAMLAGQHVRIDTDVVDSNIPLLLSKESMKRAKVHMDLENDCAEILGVQTVLNLTSSGHYCVPIVPEASMESALAVNIQMLSEKDTEKTLLKLHRQFSHPTELKLKALLVDAGVWSNGLQEPLSKVTSTCETCKTYKRTPPKPAVTMPLSQRFNDKVAMDLKKWESQWILHMIDLWSRYSMSVFIQRKFSKEVVDKIMKSWISVFGVMNSILTDNGGEFTSAEIREVASILNITVCTTAAESPFQNGTCERNHAVIDNMLMKLRDDEPNTDIEVLLCWAVMAKNTLQMCHGFSSHQLVFGQNANLPNILTDKPPALDGTTSSEIFAKHLNALHSARRAFIESETCERVRRALRCKIRASEEYYKNGDIVYYKRENHDKWLGPAKVLFQDGNVVFIRHGSTIIRASPNRMVRSGLEFAEPETQSTQESGDRKVNRQNNDSKELPAEVIGEAIGPAAPTPAQPDRIEDESRLDEKDTKVQSNDIIEFREGNEEEWKEATILNRAGKATGRNKHWYNVQLRNNDQQMSVDLENVQWRKTENTEEVNAVLIPKNQHQEPRCVEAKQAELDKLKQFNTYEQVRDNGQNVITTKWVITPKGDTVKARLVARGFEETYMTPIQTDSPTISKSALKVFLAIASSNNWSVKTIDIKSAFLQGMSLNRDVFIVPPPEAKVEEGILWKLNRCLYGLNDGARQFFMSVKEHLLSLGCEQSQLDPALFFMKERQELSGIICCHIDDFLHAGETTFETHVIKNLTKRFLAGKFEQEDFRYIGFRIIQDTSGITLDHTEYTEDMENIKVSPDRSTQKNQNLVPSEMKLLRQAVGRLNWAVQNSRPDLSFYMIHLSTKLKGGTVEDLLEAGKAIRKLKSTHSRLFFPPLESHKQGWHVVVFTDAAHANICHGTGSIGAYVVFLVDVKGTVCVLQWQANKIRRVVRSTLAAEALSLQEGLEGAFYLQRLLSEILGVQPHTLPITAFVDNISVVQAVMSTSLVDDKRLRLDIAAIKELLNTGDVKNLKWCCGNEQLANCLTKRGAESNKLLTVLHQGKCDFLFNEICKGAE